MNWAIPIALGAVVIGALLGLGGQRKGLYVGPIHTFAIVSGLAVALSQLLPESLAAIGLRALLVFAGALLLPSLLQRLSRRLFSRKSSSKEGSAPDTNLGLTLGYLGLLLHKVGDGLALGTYGGELHAGHSHLDILLAIGAHTVPVTALIVVAYQTSHGTRAALTRATGLFLATLLGIAVAGWVPGSLVESFEPWLTAAIAGLLVHVVTHDLKRDAPRGYGDRFLELIAMALGLGIVFLGGHGHDHHGGELALRASAGEALLELTLETAPALLLGLLIGALIQALGARLPDRWLRSGSAPTSALRGALLGLPLPICACGVLPLAKSLRDRGAGPALVVAFLLATPELGVETFALSVRFLGWPFAVVRLLAAVAVAFVAALALARAARPAEAAESGDAAKRCAAEGDCDRCEPALDGGKPEGSFAGRFVGAFDELLFHVAPWTVVGLIAAAYVQAVLPGAALADLGSYGADVFVVSMVAIPSYICAASATPLAAVLLAKGMSPGAVLVGLLLGPATNLATVGFLRQAFGSRATWVALLALLLTAWGLAFAVNAAPVAFIPETTEVVAHEHGWLTYLAAFALALFVFRGVWKAGFRAWAGSLGDSWGLPAAQAEHGHGGHGGHGHGGHGHGGHGHGGHGHG